MGGDSGGAIHLFVRVLGVVIDYGAAVSASALSFPGATSSNAVLRIYGVKSASPIAPTSSATAEAKTLTTAYVDWSPANSGSPIAYTTPDLSTIVQELADQGYFAGSAAALFYVKDNGSANGKGLNPLSYDLSAVDGATFSATYTKPVTHGSLKHGLRIPSRSLR